MVVGRRRGRTTQTHSTHAVRAAGDGRSALRNSARPRSIAIFVWIIQSRFFGEQYRGYTSRVRRWIWQRM
jgi:hypothetical protein